MDAAQQFIEYQAHLAALRWYLEQGVDEALEPSPTDAAAMQPEEETPTLPVLAPDAGLSKPVAPAYLGKSEAQEEAAKLAASVQTLEELQSLMAGFDGLGLKRTASNTVFGTGFAQEPRLMVIRAAPSSEEDRSGEALDGPEGTLLKNMLAAIGLSKEGAEAQNAAYCTSLSPWRAPGGRGLNPGEAEIALPFLKKQIELVKPAFLLIGGVQVARALLNTQDSLSKLRGSYHIYNGNSASVKAIVTLDLADLLQNPLQKKNVWQDLLLLKSQF